MKQRENEIVHNSTLPGSKALLSGLEYSFNFISAIQQGGSFGCDDIHEDIMFE